MFGKNIFAYWINWKYNRIVLSSPSTSSAGRKRMKNVFHRTAVERIERCGRGNGKSFHPLSSHNKHVFTYVSTCLIPNHMWKLSLHLMEILITFYQSAKIGEIARGVEEWICVADMRLFNRIGRKLRIFCCCELIHRPIEFKPFIGWILMVICPVMW